MTISKDCTAPLVVVVGATGIQGGSVIRELARSDKSYRIRGFTRDATKPAAKELEKLGVEVIAVNLVVENAAAVKDAFKGGDIAFVSASRCGGAQRLTTVVTNFWEHLNMEKEIAEGKLLIDAAHEGGAKRVIWSGLVSVAEATKGKLVHVYHFEGKAQVTAYGVSKFAGTDVAFVNVPAGLYMSNMLTPNPMSPVPKGDGTFVIRLPASKDMVMPYIDMEKDYGQFVRLAIESDEFATGGEICTVSEESSLGDSIKQLSEGTGKTVGYEHITVDAFKAIVASLGLPEFLQLDMVDAILAFEEAGYYGGRSTMSLDKLYRKPSTWKEFVASHDYSKVLA